MFTEGVEDNSRPITFDQGKRKERRMRSGWVNGWCVNTHWNQRRSLHPSEWFLLSDYSYDIVLKGQALFEVCLCVKRDRDDAENREEVERL